MLFTGTSLQTGVNTLEKYVFDASSKNSEYCVVEIKIYFSNLEACEMLMSDLQEWHAKPYWNIKCVQ